MVALAALMPAPVRTRPPARVVKAQQTGGRLNVPEPRILDNGLIDNRTTLSFPCPLEKGRHHFIRASPQPVLPSTAAASCPCRKRPVGPRPDANSPPVRQPRSSAPERLHIPQPRSGGGRPPRQHLPGRGRGPVFRPTQFSARTPRPARFRLTATPNPTIGSFQP